MKEWMNQAIHDWDALRALALSRQWPHLRLMTVMECATLCGLAWYEKRASDKVADFLKIPGFHLISYPHFGETKTQKLIEIVRRALEQGAGDNSPAYGDEIEEQPPLRDGLVTLEIPDAFPVELVGLPVRILHYCEDNHVPTLGDLLEVWESMGQSYFLSLPNLGKRSVGELHALIHAVRLGNATALSAWLPMSPNGKGLSLTVGLTRLIQGLTARHREMLEKRLVHGLTLEDSATEFGVTRERVRQIEAILLQETEALLDFFPADRERMLALWMANMPWLVLSDGVIPNSEHELAQAAIGGCFKERPESTAKELEQEAQIEVWRALLKEHPDLLVEGVDLEDFMMKYVPDQHRESLCLALDGRGRIRLDHSTGRVVHTGPRLREVVKAILAKEDDPIPLTWLHQLVIQTPTHSHIQREQIWRYRIQWKSDDPTFPREKVLWHQ